MSDKDDRIEELEARVGTLTGDFRIERVNRKRAENALRDAKAELAEMTERWQNALDGQDLADEMNRCREWLDGQAPKLLLAGKAVANFAQKLKDGKEFRNTDYPWNPVEEDYDY
jgi:hypothetical protein